MARREAFSQIIQTSSLATLAGLVIHYGGHYLFNTPLLTDHLAEWIMARTPSRWAVAILQTLGPWAKPSATTGALALLGAFLLIIALSRNSSFILLRNRFQYDAAELADIRKSRGLAFLWCVFLAVSFGASLSILSDYESLLGSLLFWLPAALFVAWREPAAEPKPVSLERRTLLLSAGVMAVAGESYWREAALARREPQPVDLFPFQPNLERADFAPTLVRKPITPVPEFYGMSKNAVDPVIDLRSWRLSITANGKLLRQFSYSELLAMPRQVRYVTLRCISNTLKSDLMGTAAWGGFPIAQLIDRRSLPPDIVEAALIGVEGHDDSLSLDYAFSNDAFLALGMNGKTLSRTHGFPLRLLAPSYYGCRNVKWIREVRFVTRPYLGTWQRLGYTKEPLIHTCSHIDHIKRDGPLVALGGVSFAGTRGIQAVRVRANGGAWQAARLEPSLSQYTWNRWAAQLPAKDGDRLEANAQDGSGAWQELAEGSPFPSGMTGPTIVVARL